MREGVKHLSLKRSIEALFSGGTVAWSADGKFLYSPCTNVVKVVNLDDNLTTYDIGDEDESLRITSICPDNGRRRLVVAYNNQMVREYSIPNSPTEKAQVVRMWKSLHTAPILHTQFNDDHSYLATGSADHNVKIWDMNAQHCTHTLKGVDVVSSICFVPSNRILVGYMTGKVNLFNLERGVTNKLLHTWETHNSQVTSICVTQEHHQAISVSRDQTATIMDYNTLQTIKVLPLFEHIESAVIVHNGNMVTVGEEGVLKEWVVKTAKLIRRKKISNDRLDFVTYNPIRDEVLCLSSMENLFVLSFSDFVDRRQIVGFHDEIYSCTFLGKDEKFLAVSSNTKEIRVYNTESWDCQLFSGHEESVICVDSAHWDKSLLLSCSKDNNVILWKFSCLEEKPKLTQIALASGHTNTVNAVKFSHSNKAPFFVSVSNDSTIKLWSLQSVDASKKSAEIIKLTSSSTLVAHAKDVNCTDISVTDALCVTGGMDKLAKLWHIDTKKMQLGIAGNLTGHRRGVADAKFSASTQKIATCSGDMTIKLWSIQEKTCLQTLSGHNSAVFNIMFINNGSQLISADSAGIIKIWTLSTAESESSIEGHTQKIWSLTARADESEYVTAGSDGRICLWKDVSEEKRAEEQNKIRTKMLEEQTLSNLLEQDRFQEALEYALGLVKPYCALKVIDQLIDRNELMQAVSKLSMQHIQVLLDFCTQWNTNSRTSQACQSVLHNILLIHTPEELLKLPNIQAVIQSLIPYTKRHMERLNKSRQDVTLLNFTWDQMRLN